MYFDKWGKPTEKPVVNKPIPAGITAKTVIDNYIKAAGGEKALKAVKTVATKSAGTIQGTPLQLTMKVSADNKQFVEMTAMGMSVMKQVVNEKGGYQAGQGGKEDFTGEKLADMRKSAVPFEELTLANEKDIKVTGIESINGAEAYAVKNGDVTYYYDVKSGLKVAEARVEEQMGQKMTQTTLYGDYKEVKGIKIPHKVTLNLGPGADLELTVSEVKINEGVTAADFQ